MGLFEVTSISPPFGSSSGASSPENLTADFWTAFKTWFDSDLTLTTAIPGGLVSPMAAPLQVYPYARMTEIEPQEPISDDDWPMQSTISFYAESNDMAWYLARLMRKKLDDSTRPPLTYFGWQEASRITSGKIEVTKLGRSSANFDVYRADLPYDFMVIRM